MTQPLGHGNFAATLKETDPELYVASIKGILESREVDLKPGRAKLIEAEFKLGDDLPEVNQTDYYWTDYRWDIARSLLLEIME